MKLLKAVLLSTSLLISVPFAADATVTAADAASPGRLNEVVATLNAFETYKKQNEQAVTRFLTRDAGIPLEELGLTAESKYVDVMRKLSTVLKDFKKQLAEATTTQAETAESLTRATAANEQLTAEKAAAERALAAANEKLATVTADKKIVDEQLAAAEAEVTRLAEVLTATEGAAEEAGRDATGVIERLTGELAAVTKERDELNAQSAELGALKDKAEEAARAKAAGLRALMNANAGGGTRAAVKAGESAATPTDDLEALLEGFSDLLTGAEVNDGSLSPDYRDDLDDVSPLRPLGATESPTARDLSTTLEAATAADDDKALRGGDTAASVDAATAARIAELQRDLAAAQAATTASPHTGKGQQRKNDDAQASARKEVARLTGQLKRLGVDVTAAASE